MHNSAKFLRFFPFLAWPRLTLPLLKSELTAGVTVGLMMIPQCVAYAAVAGMPLVTGIYASLLPALVAATLERAAAQGLALPGHLCSIPVALQAVLRDGEPTAVKVGMLGSAAIAEVVAERIERRRAIEAGRQAMLLARVAGNGNGGPDAMSARAALQLAIESPRSAVTFLDYSCSGASIDAGLEGDGLLDVQGTFTANVIFIGDSGGGIARWASSGGPAYHGMRSLSRATLSPRRADRLRRITPRTVQRRRRRNCRARRDPNPRATATGRKRGSQAISDRQAAPCAGNL